MSVIENKSILLDKIQNLLYEYIDASEMQTRLNAIIDNFLVQNHCTLYDDINDACRHLPDGYGVSICMEKDAGWVEISDWPEYPDNQIKFREHGELQADLDSAVLACVKHDSR